MSGVRGDIRILGRLAARIRGVHDVNGRAALASVLSVTAMRLVADEFKRQADPYGNRWAPFSPNTRRRRGSMSSAKLLQDTGRMRGSVHARGSPEGLRISIPTEYAPHHQYGTRTIPQRAMLPMESLGGIGPIWGPVLREAANAWFRRQFAGLRRASNG